MDPRTPASALAACLLAAAPASAVDKTRIDKFNAPAFCQGALPNFEGHLRKRPLALKNEGTANAFVSCVVAGRSRRTQVLAYVVNDTPASVPLTCTAVTGTEGSPDSHYSIKTVWSAAGQPQLLTWAPTDFPPNGAYLPSDYFALSCNLPPAAGLLSIQVILVEDVGA